MENIRAVLKECGQHQMDVFSRESQNFLRRNHGCRGRPRSCSLVRGSSSSRLLRLTIALNTADWRSGRIPGRNHMES